jgi:hypothetical protein
LSTRALPPSVFLSFFPFFFFGDSDGCWKASGLRGPVSLNAYVFCSMYPSLSRQANQCPALVGRGVRMSIHPSGSQVLVLVRCVALADISTVVLPQSSVNKTIENNPRLSNGQSEVATDSTPSPVRCSSTDVYHRRDRRWQPGAVLYASSWGVSPITCMEPPTRSPSPLLGRPKASNSGEGASCLRDYQDQALMNPFPPLARLGLSLV